jgi:hypothetical protein
MRRARRDASCAWSFTGRPPEVTTDHQILQRIGAASFVEALGGHLHVAAKFPSETIALSFQDRKKKPA